MKLSDRLTRMIDGMPDGASIILSVEDVKGWLSENGSGLDHDLTVEEVGRAGYGLVAHLSPEIARRLRGAVRDALAEMGEDPGR